MGDLMSYPLRLVYEREPEAHSGRSLCVTARARNQPHTPARARRRDGPPTTRYGHAHAGQAQPSPRAAGGRRRPGANAAMSVPVIICYTRVSGIKLRTHSTNDTCAAAVL
eukprot:6668777-Prymnesium_polylepis.2